MKKLLLILLCFPIIGFGQKTYVPDDIFEAYLEANGMGDGIPLNDSVFTSAVDTVLYLDVQSQNISDLTGIEDFVALTVLSTVNTSLTSLDVSNNPALSALFCFSGQLTSLDASNNPALLRVHCGGNQLTSLDVSGATALLELYCDNNQLVCLDISGATSLEDLTCSNNLLEQLNTKNGNWQNLDINALYNNLTCVEVDNMGYSTTNWGGSFFDNFTTFNTNCNYTSPCNSTTSIQEHTTNKELLKVTDLLGRENTNQPLFYIYDDGTVEKRIVIE